MKITDAQKRAIKRIYDRQDLGMTYLAFRRSVERACYSDCLMVEWCGMWLGIETDGYVHS